MSSMSYEDTFWRGATDVRSCACGFAMVQLFNSWVCDRCNPPDVIVKDAKGFSTAEKSVKVYYTYSSNDSLSEVGSGYKLYDDLDYITKKTCKKATSSATPYFIYKVGESKGDYLDYSGTRPVSSRRVKVSKVGESHP